MRPAAAAAYGGLGLTTAASAAAIGLYASDHATPVDFGDPRPITLAIAGVGVAFSAVGALIVVRRPGNPVGWLFAGLGVMLGGDGFAREYAVFAVVARPHALAGGGTAAWFQSWGLLTAITFGPGLLFLLFPNGRLLSPRWRIALWAVALGFVLFVAGYTLQRGPLDAPFASVDNPLGVTRSHAAAWACQSAGWWLLFLSILAAATSVVLRFRRAGGIERQQIKWLATAGAALALSFIADVAVSNLPTAQAVATGLVIAALVGIPAAAGTAVLRHGLYEIDVVINRALVYGSLTALLAGAYVGLVLLFQLVLRSIISGSGLAVALSTLAVAALFRPARIRIQGLVDRRFYRRKYDAERTLQGFTSRLRDELDLESLGSELLGVVAETMQPSHLSLRLRSAPDR
jgi:hypothetical protein